MTTNEIIGLPLRDLTEAGRLLAAKLQAYAGRSDMIVFAIGASI
jgi:predicted phosphoribosyltransferase